MYTHRYRPRKTDKFYTMLKQVSNVCYLQYQYGDNGSYPDYVKDIHFAEQRQECC